MKLCAHPGCRTLVPQGRCAEHARQQDTQRGTATERGYDETWRRFSKARLQRFPFCGMQADGSMSSTKGSRCAARGLTVPATCTDHIQPMSQGGAQYDEANLQSLCIPCNTAKAHTLERVQVKTQPPLVSRAIVSGPVLDEFARQQQERHALLRAAVNRTSESEDDACMRLK